jgi:ubiquinone/menaquinone biosynthesis C-methylase UbiE
MTYDTRDFDLLKHYVAPASHTALSITDDALVGAGKRYTFLPGFPSNVAVPNFTEANVLDVGAKQSLAMYDFEGAREIYRNFLSWMYRTFRVDEDAFRQSLIAYLGVADGGRVLITGCGIGDDVFAVLDAVGPNGQVYASDLAPEMVAATYAELAERRPDALTRVSLSVCDACHLPFEDGFFDAAFHFGGINLFDDVKGAIHEMTRVTKEGGRVVFGDEGVAPWLVGTDYGKMVVANNYLWAHRAPIEWLPFSAVSPVVRWVLGNCFYVVTFEKCSSGPVIDPDVPHVGRRGGSMRSRYYGQLEGVSVELRERVLKEAAAQKISVAEWLEGAINASLNAPERSGGE